MHSVRVSDRKTNDFSAVCLLYAEELSPHVNRPIGLVESAFGGTAIEAWSSPDAINKCTSKIKRYVNYMYVTMIAYVFFVMNVHVLVCL